MVSKEIALEALGALCKADVTSVQSSRASSVSSYGQRQASHLQAHEELNNQNFFPTVLNADESRPRSISSFEQLKGILLEEPRANAKEIEKALEELDVLSKDQEKRIERFLAIDEDEFLDPEFNKDFTKTETKRYERGGEEYRPPYGWYRFGLKVLDKYNGEKSWLGTGKSRVCSVPGEWPVSYHGTSLMGAKAIIEGRYKPGGGQRYGRGIYSTPYIEEAIPFATEFKSRHDGKNYKIFISCCSRFSTCMYDT